MKYPKQERRSILQILMQYLKKKPVTEEELIQLRLEAEKYRLKADIEISKSVIRDSKGEKFNLGDSVSRRSGLDKSYSNTEDKISGLLRGAVGAKNADFFSMPDISGNNEDKSEKEKEAYRKRVLGL